jgi:spore coat polysaccharide biosynthesis protein SpsF (cytidylyltransferase family)
MDIVGNLSVDHFDRRKMPNDIRVTYYNWQEVLERSSYDYTVDKKVDYTSLYELAIQKELLSWREVEAKL